MIWVSCVRCVSDASMVSMRSVVDVVLQCFCMQLAPTPGAGSCLLRLLRVKQVCGLSICACWHIVCRCSQMRLDVVKALSDPSDTRHHTVCRHVQVLAVPVVTGIITICAVDAFYLRRAHSDNEDGACVRKAWVCFFVCSLQSSPFARLFLLRLPCDEAHCAWFASPVCLLPLHEVPPASWWLALDCPCPCRPAPAPRPMLMPSMLHLTMMRYSPQAWYNRYALFHIPRVAFAYRSCSCPWASIVIANMQTGHRSPLPIVRRCGCGCCRPRPPA